MLAALIVIAASHALVARQPPATQPPPTFRIDIEHVELDASVIVANRRPVTDLKAED